MNKMITHVIVDEVIIGKKPLIKRIRDFILRRRKKFTMPALCFVSKDGKRMPLINLEYGIIQSIELPCPIDEREWSFKIINSNEYPVTVKLKFI